MLMAAASLGIDLMRISRDQATAIKMVVGTTKVL